MLKKLRPGDLAIVKSIDRLGRNYNYSLVQWQYITKEIGTDIFLLDLDLLDTRKKSDNLTGALIADLTLQIFAYLVQTEREFIRQRQAERIAAAKAKGRKWDESVLPCQRDLKKSVRSINQDGHLSIRKVASLLGMSSTTFLRRYTE